MLDFIVQSRHPSLIKAFDKACDVVTQSTKKRRQHEGASSNETTTVKQPKVDVLITAGPLTQAKIDTYVVVCICNYNSCTIIVWLLG